jgi:predicted dehydrogenase
VTETSPNGSSAPVGVAVVGLGYWGPNLLRVLSEDPAQANVLYACDTSAETRVAIGRRFRHVTMTGDYQSVLDDPAVEAVAIATPVSTHFELADRALDAGKHVFVEKPLAHGVAEVEQLIAKAQRNGLVLMPGHTFIYSPPVVRIKELIDRGELGDIYFITMSRVNLGLHQPDVSVIWDLAPHDISILSYWLGETADTASAAVRACIVPSIPDVAFVNLRFPSGTIVHVELSWLAPSKLRRTAIVGARKMVVYDDTSTEPVRIFDAGADLPDPETFGEYRMTYRTGDVLSLKIDPAEPLALELAEFLRAVRGGPAPRSSPALGLEVVRTIEAVHRSLDSGGIPVAVVDPDLVRE